MRALFEICLRRGWCEMTLFMLEYCKAVDRRIWPHQHPLRQFDKDLSLDVCLNSIYYSFRLSQFYFIIPSDLFPLLKLSVGFLIFPFFFLCYQILRKLEEREADLDRLQEMQEKDIGALIRYVPGGRVGLIIRMF